MPSTAETRSARNSEAWREQHFLTFDIGIEARTTLPEDVQDIVKQAMFWMNKDHAWLPRRVTVGGFDTQGLPVTSQKLRDYLSRTSPQDEPLILGLNIQFRAANPPYKTSGFGPFKSVSRPDLKDIVSPSVNTHELDTGEALQLFPDLYTRVGEGTLIMVNDRLAEQNGVSSKDKYFFSQAFLYKSAGDVHNTIEPNLKGMTHADTHWPNVFMEVTAINVYGKIASEIKRLQELQENQRQAQTTNKS